MHKPRHYALTAAGYLRRFLFYLFSTYSRTLVKHTPRPIANVTDQRPLYNTIQTPLPLNRMQITRKQDTQTSFLLP